MKTRRNHRHKTVTVTATATGRRRRNTRIHRRKRTTVSSGRRRHFFKRGGQLLFTTDTSKQLGTYSNGSNGSRYVASFSQTKEDKKQREKDAAANAERDAAQKAQEIGYPDVDEFVSKTKTTNVSTQTDIPNIKFIVKKLPKKYFYIDNVKNGKSQQPVTRTINEKNVKFYVDSDGNTVVIYVDDILYGYVMIKINNEAYDSSNRGIYSPTASDAIKRDLELTST
jgi:hypothetical protein